MYLDVVMTKTLKMGADEESLYLTSPETTCEDEATSSESKATKQDSHIDMERERTCRRYVSAAAKK